MKSLLVLLLSILLFALPCYAGSYRDFNTNVEESGLDWVGHVAVGAGISALSDHYLLKDIENPWIRKPLLVLIPFGVGCIKESFDQNFDWQDASEWGVGGGLYLGYTVVW